VTRKTSLLLTALFSNSFASAAMLPEPVGDYEKKFDIVDAQSIPEVYCSLDITKLQMALNWRDTGIPVRAAQSQLFDWRAEQYIDLRIYYQRLVAEIYQHPAVAFRYIHSGRAYDECVLMRRGY